MAGEKRTGMALRKGSKLIVFLFACLSAACSNTLFHRYVSPDNGVWAKSDTLLYTLEGGLSGGGELLLNADVRFRPGYPYENLVMRVEAVAVNDSVLFTDTLVCRVYDENGRHLGSTAGLLYQQSSAALRFTFSTDTFRVRLSHIMACDSLNGVADVGLKIIKAD